MDEAVLDGEAQGFPGLERLGHRGPRFVRLLLERRGIRQVIRLVLGARNTGGREEHGKRGYLADLPLVMRYTLGVAEAYPELGEFAGWFRARVLPLAAAQDWYRPR